MKSLSVGTRMPLQAILGSLLRRTAGVRTVMPLLNARVVLVPPHRTTIKQPRYDVSISTRSYQGVEKFLRVSLLQQ
jgi:hypothetical protein